MIRVEATPVTELEAIELRKWLTDKSYAEVVRRVNHRIAKLQAEAANFGLKDISNIVMQRDVPPATKIALAEAAEWLIFLNKLTELREHTQKFSTYSFHGQ